ncbi:MAG: anti-sigma factor [Pseudomonadota bacterium]
MNEHNSNKLDELIELALTGNGISDDAGLNEAARQASAASAADFALDVELAAASLMVASLNEPVSPMPNSLRDKVIAGSRSFVQPADNVTPISRATQKTTTPPSSTGVLGYLGWATAAALLVALLVRQDPPPVDIEVELPVVEVMPTIDEARTALLSDPETVTLPWIKPEVEGYETVTGDVVWNNREQRGYLRLANLPANDPTVSQYQLWIVDPDRDANPVDGGVFNMTAASGDVLIPIDAKLPIVTPKAFAITREQPGGVVVSEGPLLVVAAS